MSGEKTAPEWVPPPLHQFDDDGFVLPPFEASKFPFVVVVAGGVCYSPGDGRFVRRKVLALLAYKLTTHNVAFHLAPSPGAARILYDTLDAGHKHSAQVIHRGRELWGRAADFRSAFALMDCAHALILFEPLDLIARYAKQPGGSGARKRYWTNGTTASPRGRSGPRRERCRLISSSGATTS